MAAIKKRFKREYISPMRQVKHDARQWLKQHPRWLLPASLRVVFTIACVYTLWLFAYSYAFDQHLKDFNANTTNVKEFLFTLLFCVLGRWLCDKWLYHHLYETADIPLTLILAVALRTFIYTFAIVFGLWLSVYLQTPIYLQIFWFIWTPYVWVWSRQLGSQSMANYHRTHDWKQAFKQPPEKGTTKAFFWWEVCNVITFGLTTLWTVPYKRKTLQYYIERK